MFYKVNVHLFFDFILKQPSFTYCQINCLQLYFLRDVIVIVKLKVKFMYHTSKETVMYNS